MPGTNSGHVLVGGAHDDNQIAYYGITKNSYADSFAVAIGAGIDVRVTRNFSIGPSMDYAPTSYSSAGGDWQNNWQVSVIVKFRW